MIRIALAVVAAIGVIFMADAATRVYAHAPAHNWVGGLCQDPHGVLVACSGSGGASQVGPLCQDPNGVLVVCSKSGGASQVGPLCQSPNGSLIVCPR